MGGTTSATIPGIGNNSDSHGQRVDPTRRERVSKALANPTPLCIDKPGPAHFPSRIGPSLKLSPRESARTASYLDHAALPGINISPAHRRWIWRSSRRSWQGLTGCRCHAAYIRSATVLLDGAVSGQCCFTLITQSPLNVPLECAIDTSLHTTRNCDCPRHIPVSSSASPKSRSGDRPTRILKIKVNPTEWIMATLLSIISSLFKTSGIR